MTSKSKPPSRKLSLVPSKPSSHETSSRKPSLEGVKIAADLLNHMDPETRNRIMKNVAKENPHLATKIQEALFTFEDLVKLEDRQVQALTREIPMPKLALALRNTSEAIKELIFKNLSKKGRDLLQEEIDGQGPQPASIVQAAQAEIVAAAKRLLGR